MTDQKPSKKEVITVLPKCLAADARGKSADKKKQILTVLIAQAKAVEQDIANHTKRTDVKKSGEGWGALAEAIGVIGGFFSARNELAKFYSENRHMDPSNIAYHLSSISQDDAVAYLNRKTKEDTWTRNEAVNIACCYKSSRPQVFFSNSENTIIDAIDRSAGVSLKSIAASVEAKNRRYIPKDFVSWLLSKDFQVYGALLSSLGLNGHPKNEDLQPKLPPHGNKRVNTKKNLEREKILCEACELFGKEIIAASRGAGGKVTYSAIVEVAVDHWPYLANRLGFEVLPLSSKRMGEKLAPKVREKCFPQVKK
tara:strand:- start:2857 stop:3789 length:933 start_codon:yes stop_codon:yes gene_type:complete